MYSLPKLWYTRQKRATARVAPMNDGEACIMDLPKRKQIRLREYDYSAPGAYFVTICTHERRCILSDIAVGALHEAPAISVRLTQLGQIVDETIRSLLERYSDLTVDQYVVMPNHIHLLLRIKAERALREAPLRENGTRSLLAKAVGYLKMNSSKRIREIKPEMQVWQRSYHEHVIRNEDDYRQIWEYIDTNPAKWEEDRYYGE